ncbi:ATP phosphoribosyltransferase regulatory subunit [Lachnospiraceae bacterium RM5]|nr:ATP phosphoribosyltransferase regulatory subunit [Lachnospiraceae bacterium RM5]
MNSKLLHTPVGVRDIYGDEYKEKLVVMDKIHNVFVSYGYSDIQTPTFEFFDIFNKERGSVPSKDMYKFFDREGNTLVLRPDMTPSVARAVAKYYADEEMPVRFCYEGNAFINNSEYQGKLKEFTQVGAELIDDTTSDADAEIIAMMIEALLSANLDEFQIEIGMPEFFKGLVSDAGFDDDVIEELTELLECKKYFGVEDLLDRNNAPEKYKEIFMEFQSLFGSVEILDKALSLTENKKCVQAVNRLKKIYKILSFYGFEKYISFDLSMLDMYKYYTGIVFKGYTYGTGDAIVTGGRYDNLLKQFGKDAGAIGMAFNIDQIMVALDRQHKKIDTENDMIMVLYKETNRNKAISYSDELRKSGKKVLLMRKRSKHETEEYFEYAKKNGIKHMVLVDKEITDKEL